MESCGLIYTHGDGKIFAGKSDDKIYAIGKSNGSVICCVRGISNYVHKNRVVFVKTTVDTNYDMKLEDRSSYLVDLESLRYIEVDDLIRREDNTFITESNIIYWDGRGFEYTGEETPNSEDEDNSIEQFLQGARLEFGGRQRNAKSESEIDVSFLKKFEKLGDGNMDEKGFIPPTQPEYTNEGFLMIKYSSETKNEIFENNKRAWKNRLRRAWVSFVRETHFSKKIEEYEDSFNGVYNSTELDLEGADTVITHGDQEYHINLIVDTENSWKHLIDKKERRHNNSNLIKDSEEHPVNIVLAVDVYNGDGADVIKTENNTDMYLYSDNHRTALERVIKENVGMVKSSDGQVLCRKLPDKVEEIEEIVRDKF